MNDPDHEGVGHDDPGEVPIVDESMLPELVAALIKDGKGHTEKLRGLNSTVDALTSTLAEHGAALRDLKAAFDALEQALIAQADLETPSRWAWPFLTRDEARQLWRELRWFVDWFITRYPLSGEVSIPPCWYRHEQAVDELTDVCSGWRAVYCAGDPPSTAMIEWRDRWLWPALERLAIYADWRECKQARHHVPPSARQEPTDDGFDAFVAADVAVRSETRGEDLPWVSRQPSQ